MTLVRRVLGALVLSLTLAGSAGAQSLIRDAEIEKTLREMSAPVLEAAGLAPASVELYILDARSLNAFVAGGRRMFFHTGLLIELETPEELLGVIAHEAGHIAGGHLARRAINLRNAQGPAAIGTLLGVLAGALGGGEAGAAIIFGSRNAIERSLLKFNRSEEAAADQAGLAYLERARIDPRGLQKVLERFRGQEVLSIGNVDPYILTHPLTTERTMLIERKIDAVSGHDWPKNPDRDYWHARLRAKLFGYIVDPVTVLNALEGKPEDEITLYSRAYALQKLPDRAGALATADKLIALRPNDPFYHELKGEILLDFADAAGSVAAYRKAAALAPDQPLIKAGLGRALLAMNEPGADAEALEVLKDARARDLADAAALRGLATAYERSGDRAMANLATAERFALAGRPKDAVLFARRAEAALPTGSPAWLRAQDILKLDIGEN